MTVSRRLRFEILRRDGHACRYCGAMAPDTKLTVDHVIPVALGGSDEPSNLVTACADCNAGKTSISPDSGLVEDVASDALRWARAIEQSAHNLLADRELTDALTDRFLAEWQKWYYPVEVTVSAEPVPPTGDVLVDNWRRLLGWPASCSRPVSFSDGVLTIQVERGYAKDTRAALNLVATRAELAQLLGSPVVRVEIAEGWPGPLPSPPRDTKRVEKHSYPLPGGWRDSVARFAALGLPEEEIHRLLEVAMRKHIGADERFRFFCGCCWRAITDLQEDARRLLEMERGPDAT
jgi:hypothetical protein